MEYKCEARICEHRELPLAIPYKEKKSGLFKTREEALAWIETNTSEMDIFWDLYETNGSTYKRLIEYKKLKQETWSRELWAKAYPDIKGLSLHCGYGFFTYKDKNLLQYVIGEGKGRGLYFKVGSESLWDTAF